MSRIYVVDDDPDVLDLTCDVLKRAGHAVSAFATPRAFLKAVEQEPPELAVLDMNLPGISGHELLKILRGNAATARLPMLAFSGAMRATKNVVDGLEYGADEYLLKPVDAELLRVRVDGLLRRAGRAAAAARADERVLRVDGLVVGLDSREVRVEDRAVKVTRLEFDLLVYLMRHPGQIVARSTLLEKVWGAASDGTPRAVDKRVEKLRARLGAHGVRIKTVFGFGYSFDA